MMSGLENKWIERKTKDEINLERMKGNNKVEDYISFKEIVEENNSFKISPSFNSSDSLPGKSLNGSDEQERFVIMCQESIDKNELPENFDRLTVKERFHHLTDNVDKYFPNVPESLRYILAALFQNGDCGRSMIEKPDWLDKNKFLKGQEFIRRHLGGYYMSMILSLFMVFVFTDGLKSLISTQKSNTPYRAFKRYVSTICRITTWFNDDPWSEGTRAHKNIKAVRMLHSINRQKFCNMSYEELDKTSKIQNISSPTFNVITEDFKDACPLAAFMQCPPEMTRTASINQGDMSGTQCAFMGLMLMYPEKFGAHNVSEEDLEAFCHFWRGIGYLLGIEDRYNFCRGSLQEVRNRSKDFIEHWVKPLLRTVLPTWEHMCRCSMEGIGYNLPMPHYEVSLLYFCEVINIDMPRLYKYLSFQQKLIYTFCKLLFSYILKVPGVFLILNKLINIYVNRAQVSDE